LGGKALKQSLVKDGLLASHWGTGIALLLLCCGTMAWGGGKPSKTIPGPDGTPVRKVYIQTALPNAATSVAAQLAQDTCLVTVANMKDADAVLDLGVALPTEEGGLSSPNIFGTPAKAQTLSNAKGNSQLSATVTCNDDKGSKNCAGSNNIPAGDLLLQAPSGVTVGPDTNYDVSLVSKQDNSQQLWSPEAHNKRPWTEQLRIAAGCPVCPHGHFDRRKYKSYRAWIEGCSAPSLQVYP
jgi:hypothetical protein